MLARFICAYYKRASLRSAQSAQTIIVENTSDRAKKRWHFALERITSGFLRSEGSIVTHNQHVNTSVTAFWNWRYCFTASREQLATQKIEKKNELRVLIENIREEARIKHQLNRGGSGKKRKHDSDSDFEEEQPPEVVLEDNAVYARLMNELNSLRHQSVFLFKSAASNQLKKLIEQDNKRKEELTKETWKRSSDKSKETFADEKKEETAALTASVARTKKRLIPVNNARRIFEVSERSERAM